MILALLDAELRRDEGVYNVIYYDSLGIPTTGVGHNLQASPLPVGWTYPLTDAQVTQLENYDINIALNELNLHLPWWSAMDEVRQRVIANMCFQLGINRLLGFHNTLASMQAGDYAAAAAGMQNSIWYGQSGDRSVRLCKAMLTGAMPDEPTV
ncbi:glycoside hydrolase family protein [Paraburkholderia ferrariae]|uniref:Lysozyme n=1 Tax=Paraburkholderia ferrariae TaxID=386056 RepID=A0ABU9RXC0_9BURK